MSETLKEGPRPPHRTRSVQEIRRRRLLLAWVPTAIGVILIAVVVAVTINTSNSGVGRPVPAPTTDSRFDAQGLAYIDRSRITRVNISSTPISSESLGMKPNQKITITNDQGLDEYLQLEGNETFARVTVKTFSISTRDGFVEAITIPPTNTAGFTGLRTELQAASVYGVSQQAAARALDVARAGNIDGKATAQSIGPVTALKVPVTVIVASTGGGEYTVGYTIDLSGRSE
jgi:hypothetical protein